MLERQGDSGKQASNMSNVSVITMAQLNTIRGKVGLTMPSCTMQVMCWWHLEGAGRDGRMGVRANTAAICSPTHARTQVAMDTRPDHHNDERLRLKALSEERASRWPNTLQVRSRHVRTDMRACRLPLPLEHQHMCAQYAAHTRCWADARPCG